MFCIWRRRNTCRTTEFLCEVMKKNVLCKRILFSECKGNVASIGYLTCSSKNLEKTENFNSNNNKENEKITVTKTSLLTTKKRSAILERTKESNVIKKQNSPKFAVYNRKKELNQNMHNEMDVPVCRQLKMNLESYNQTTFNICPDTASNIISSFPLTKLSKSYNESKLEDFNDLRQYLESLCESSVPSVTSILLKTLPKDCLRVLNQFKHWRINELGEEEGLKEWQKDLSNERTLHTTINNYLSGKDFKIKEEDIGHWKSLKDIFPTITGVKLLGETVTHPFLCYSGVVDCLAEYENQLVVINWSVPSDMTLFVKEAISCPLRIAASVGALNFDPKFHHMVKEGLLVITCEYGKPASHYFIDARTMNCHWKAWLSYLKHFWELKQFERNNYLL